MYLHHIDIYIYVLISIHKYIGEVAQSCLTLCDPMDRSLPGSSVHVIFQARVLEWVAIHICNYMPSVSYNSKWKKESWCKSKIYISWPYAITTSLPVGETLKDTLTCPDATLVQ